MQRKPCRFVQKKKILKANEKKRAILNRSNELERLLFFTGRTIIWNNRSVRKRTKEMENKRLFLEQTK